MKFVCQLDAVGSAEGWRQCRDCEICSHGGDYKNVSLSGCDVMKYGTTLSVFRINNLLPSFYSEGGSSAFSGTSVNFYQNPQHHILKDVYL
jgi:hypothetical protein